VRKIAFTGSPRVGKLLMDGASRTLTRLTLELGGNAPGAGLPRRRRHRGRAAVRDVEAAQRRPGVRGAAALLLHETSPTRSPRRSSAETAALRVGHGLEDGTQVGPLITDRHRERVADLVARSVAAGARLLTGGAPLDRPGFFYAPTCSTTCPTARRC
jgi:succinate-semialdehyde dehydrogenase / glutarate-semialdehyde dehydrogenase